MAAPTPSPPTPRAPGSAYPPVCRAAASPPPRCTATGRGPLDVAIADFNGDGKADLAVADSGDDDVAILLGRGDGTFLPAQRITAVRGARSIATADLDLNGLPDLVVAGNGEIASLLNSP